MYAFDAFELDPGRYELRRDGEQVHVEPQVFDLLRYLIENRDRVVSKDDILTEIWGGRFVSEAALTTQIKAARKAVGDTGEEQRLIRTVRQRGYQFVGAVGGSAATPQPPRLAQDVRFCHGEDGVRIAYALTGSGTPLVKAANWMTHLGYDLDSPVWRHWLTALSAHHRLIRYDERGCGLSEWELPRFCFDDWVRDLELVVDDAGLETFPLLGISQGAAVAVAYAVRHPERMDRLILVGGYPLGRGARARTVDEKRAAALDLELARVGWGKDDPAFRRVFAMQFLPEGTHQEWAEFDELQRRTTSPANAVKFLETFADIDIRDRAPDVACPTLILHSRDDHRVPFGCAQQLADLIPRSRLIPLPSRNHLLTGHETAWPMFVDEVNHFTR